jgi:hypothetical protein
VNIYGVQLNINDAYGYRGDWRQAKVKYVLLSADNNPSVYSVPDEVADNLKKYCLDFCDKWMYENPDAKKYHIGEGVCYNEEDFIEYLNKWIFPDMSSVFVEKIGFIDSVKDIPEKYKGCEWFNF